MKMDFVLENIMILRRAALKILAGQSMIGLDLRENRFCAEKSLLEGLRVPKAVLGIEPWLAMQGSNLSAGHSHF